ncbi:ribbon-helix-helix protein, CopG family [Streptomonospora sp. PA3]|uniref:plasmid mobilization protein n=1 Tax=Streptomonospora sp. PA3 TaxID=2607326 RepID=UPI001306E041|nr:ribbon-helix-helix protein, CopG family [Streptomonospora sp. PA3]
MSKVRISISLDPEQAERIRAHAERAGMDVSAYFVNAATRQMAETEAIEDKFREIDALIDSVEAEGRELKQPSDDGADSAALTEDERRRVETAVGLVLGTEDDASPGNAAA